MVFVIMLVAIAVLSPVERSRKAAPAAVYYLEITAMEQVNGVCARLEGMGSLQIVPAKSGLPGHVGLLLTAEFQTDSQNFLRQLQNLESVAAAVPTTL